MQYRALSSQFELKLFKWRAQYLNGMLNFLIPEEEYLVFTYPSLITQNFDVVMALAVFVIRLGLEVHFIEDEIKSAIAFDLFDNDDMTILGDVGTTTYHMWIIENRGLTFCDILHMIQATFPGKPKFGQNCYEKSSGISSFAGRASKSAARKGSQQGNLQQF